MSLSSILSGVSSALFETSTYIIPPLILYFPGTGRRTQSYFAAKSRISQLSQFWRPLDYKSPSPQYSLASGGSPDSPLVPLEGHSLRDLASITPGLARSFLFYFIFHYSLPASGSIRPFIRMPPAASICPFCHRMHVGCKFH